MTVTPSMTNLTPPNSTQPAGAPGRDWHALSPDGTLAALEARSEGLSTAQAQQRLAMYGPNVLPKPKGDTALDLLWRQINSPLIWVLIASGVVAMVVDPTDGIKNGLVILAVVALNTIIGLVQEVKAGKASEALC